MDIETMFGLEVVFIALCRFNLSFNGLIYIQYF